MGAFRAGLPQGQAPDPRADHEGLGRGADRSSPGNVFGTINQRRGMIVSSVEDGTFSRVDAEVPAERDVRLLDRQLRSLTQGKAEFTMEFLKYGRVPAAVAEELTAAATQEKRRRENAERERKETARWSRKS